MKFCASERNSIKETLFKTIVFKPTSNFSQYNNPIKEVTAFLKRNHL